MKRIGFTILLVATIIFSFLFISLHQKNSVLAQASCPPNIDPDSIQCLEYLERQISILEKQQGTLQKQLKNEEYQQLSLQEKISYINTQVIQTEQEIKTLQIEIAATDVEINLLEKEIKKHEDSISLLKQEISVLSATVNDRITESYKFSFVNQFEIFLDIRNISSVLRRSKYLATTRNKDKKALEQHASTVIELGKEEAELQKSKAELEIKKQVREEEKSKLAEVKQSLDSQKREREKLLAESRVKGAQLLAAYNSNISLKNQYDKAIIDYMNKHPEVFQYMGWVTTSTPIGRMGNTGCSSGSHLHLGLNSGKSYPGWGYFYSDVNLFSGGYLKKAGTIYWPYYAWDAPIIVSGSARAPFSAPYIFMHQSEHQGNAIDMASYSKKDWGYKIEGAPVYPIMPGELETGIEKVCGGKFAKITHSNGMISIYLHLQ